MSEEEGIYHKLPMEWIDRIFMRLEYIYGKKWTEQFCDKDRERIYKVMWQSGLMNCTATEIKRAIDVCMKELEMLKDKANPPHMIEFWNYAKGHRIPHLTTEKKMTANPQVARKAMDEINRKLGRRPQNGNDSDSPLSAIG